MTEQTHIRYLLDVRLAGVIVWAVRIGLMVRDRQTGKREFLTMKRYVEQQ